MPSSAEQARVRLQIRGRVLEREATDSGVLTGPDSDSFVPLAALQPVCRWPAFVDPARRESYLSPEDFDESALGMGREAFEALPPWRRTELKKAAGLF